MVETDKLFFYEAVVQQLLDDGLEDAAEIVKSKMKVEPNTMLRKDHLYDIFNKSAYLSSRTILEADLEEEERDKTRGLTRLKEVLDEYESLPIEKQHKYKVMAYNNFAEFQNFKPCRCIAQSNDSSVVAIGGVSGYLHVTPFVDANDQISKRKPNGMCTTRLNGHIEQVDALDFHPRRTILASGGIDCNIIFHEINASNGFIYSTSELQKINDYFNIRCLKFHPCGDFLFAGTSNSILRLYDVVTAKCYTSRQTLHQHQGGGINSCDVNSAGSLFFTAGSDGSVALWDGKTLEAIHIMESIHGGVPVISVKCDPYSRYILSSGLNGTTKLVDLRMRKELHSFGFERKNSIRTYSTFLHNFQYFITFSVLSDNKSNRSEAIVYSIENAAVEMDITKALGTAPIWDAIASHDEMSIITVAEDCKCQIINFYDPTQ
ncbi:cleavage stimulation factor subunit 1, putative [Theileria equi strain WA]|uniref:Cleavage stimulation factor 50 kDa subunit n=1 Tax=Theileria equi strain WA TaxID=1537102 RepID=L0AVK8_THEEQ|nr:cleavage stimulation factor subunit 1, putative [Theileria equi strain WA]AFZ79647.1 cleavage stimulation factor subunit 1, putative [Theileria equi strain WA]|eukprot:XP_004829313.1 cleavage stimulation factor subunit 1, putative [Theileria equi strain WA]